nr:hypothetical protein [Tanacetum cinerariifolium]
VKQKKDGIFISQDKYVAEILRKFRLSEGKLASTPIDAEKPLLKDSDGEDVDVYTYRNVVMEIVVLNILSDALPITTNGIQLTMVFNSPMLPLMRVEMVINSLWMLSKNWLVQKQTDFGKDISNPFMADNLPKMWKLHSLCSYSESSYLPSSPPQQPQSPLQAPPQGAEFPPHIQQVLDVCSALTRHVENLENDKAAQKMEIIKLKARVKRLEKANMVKSSKLRRLRKVGASRRIESSDDMEDVFNQGRMIDDMDKDEGIELVKDADDEGIELVKDANIAETEGRHVAEQTKKQAEIYNLDLDHSFKVLSMQEDDSEVQKVVEILTTAKLITDVVTAASQVSATSATISTAKLSVPAAPIVVAAYTRRRKGVIIRYPEEELSSKTPAETPKLKDKSKGILIETLKPMKKKDQIELDAEYAKKLHEEINKDHKEFNKDIDWDAAMDHEEDQEIIKSINETPAQKAAKKRKLSEEAQEAEDLRKRLEVVYDEDDDVFIEVTPLARKVPVVDYQIVLVDNKPRFKIIKADETHQFYISFTTLLKIFYREDLENLWGIVKKRFSTIKPTNFSDEYLLLTLKTMFEKPDKQDVVWKSQRSVHGLALLLELMVLKRSRKNTKCVNAANEELTAAKHKLMLLVYCC